MRLNHQVTKKEFAREIFVGGMAVVCLFAIFLFVAIQKATGRSLSPLAYLWPEEKNIAGDTIPVVVFKTEKDRQEAKSQYESPKPMLEKMVARFKESTERHRGKRLAKEETTNVQQPVKPNSRKPNLIPIISSPDARFPANQDSVSLSTPRSLNAPSSLDPPRVASLGQQALERPRRQNPNERGQLDTSKPPVSKPFLRSQTKVNHRVQPGTLADSSRIPLEPSAAKAIQMPGKVHPKATAASFEVDAPAGRQDHPQTRAGFQSSRIAPQKRENIEPKKQWLRVTPKANDSFWTLSVDHYNDGRHFASLARFNRCVDNIDDLPTTVWVPSLAELKAFSSGLAKEKKAASGPGHLPRKSDFYLTQSGETLFDIAREKLGAGARFV